MSFSLYLPQFFFSLSLLCHTNHSTMNYLMYIRSLKVRKKLQNKTTLKRMFHRMASITMSLFVIFKMRRTKKFLIFHFHHIVCVIKYLLHDVLMLVVNRPKKKKFNETKGKKREEDCEYTAVTLQ